ncbi:unnamed protein product [Fusarium venenatum]|uniref:Uncharacterized protein n=1 Tax=Fusarium venenatum TaxID=56646 RepID=A0A2L2T0I9_9HYPO|nr:uncharacterized protein FVRRES_05299 [Fusarium venenatum]CEI60863.1 unnamed protein product [Fusarium venenatum]
MSNMIFIIVNGRSASFLVRQVIRWLFHRYNLLRVVIWAIYYFEITLQSIALFITIVNNNVW